jgi:hypothetical protein|tara:strand:+ start:676 stop:879 length:204 start_codon:yes stop_codon:yes gene_type:complete
MNQSAKDLADIMTTFMDRNKTVSNLNNYYKKNILVVNLIKDLDKNIYDDLIGTFKEHKKEILNKSID